MHWKSAVDAAHVAHCIVQIKIIIHPQHTWRFLSDEDVFKFLVCESIVRCLGQLVNVEEEGTGREKLIHSIALGSVDPSSFHYGQPSGHMATKASSTFVSCRWLRFFSCDLVLAAIASG
jgi:hypothetical protein